MMNALAVVPMPSQISDSGIHAMGGMGRSQRVAAEHQLEAGPQVGAQHRAVGLRVGELDKKRLQNRGGGAQILGVHHPQPDGGLPQRQQHKDCPSGQHQQPQLFPPLVLPLFFD